MFLNIHIQTYKLRFPNPYPFSRNPVRFEALPLMGQGWAELLWASSLLVGQKPGKIMVKLMGGGIGNRGVSFRRMVE